ncbi:hypothetical protein L7F22_061255 [Adiantum nelumboides]|nr:hypothetical protein [Adiantum nelumboides]
MLQVEDLTLLESRAVARYVAEKYKKQGASLYGSTIVERALINQWIELEGKNYAPAGHLILYQLVIGPMRGVPTDVALVEESLVKFEKVLDMYEEQMGKTPYLSGYSFSLADMTHLPLTHYLMNLAKLSPAFDSKKNFMAWWERISARPAWKKVSAMFAS